MFIFSGGNCKVDVFGSMYVPVQFLSLFVVCFHRFFPYVSTLGRSRRTDAAEVQRDVEPRAQLDQMT